MRILYRYQPITTVKYGLLYNWYAATDVRNISSIGWHVPTNIELITLWSYTTTSLYFRLKTVGTTYWSVNSDGTNEFKFNSKGAGIRLDSGGAFGGGGNMTIYTSSTSKNSNLVITTTSMGFNNSTTSGFSIRLIKDSTTLTHGQSGLYRGNDGKIYPTICIGTQEWLAENLVETKYRNGDTIPEVSDNNAWAALTTGALCAYNNDWNKV